MNRKINIKDTKDEIAINYTQIAEQIVGGKLHSDLQNHLDVLNAELKNIGAALRSRQVIVLAINQWQIQHPARSPKA